MEITKDLQNTLKSKPRVEKVYFDAKGRHYFNVFSLPSEEGKNPVLYGSGLFSHKQLIPGPLNIDGLKEDIAKGDPGRLIVEEMTREEILSASTKPDADSLVSQILNASDQERNAAMSALGLTPDLLALLNKFKDQEAPIEEKKTVTPKINKK